VQHSDRSPSTNDSPDLPNGEWELSELIQLVTAELDQAQDTLILKSQNRRLSMMVNQLNLDLQVDVRHDPSGRLMFRTAPSGQTGATVLKLGFTPALDTQVQETRKSIDLDTDILQPLTTLLDIQDSEIQRLKTVGIHSVNDLTNATQTPAMLTEVSLKAGLDETRLRLWRQWPLIATITPERGTPGSIVVIDGGNFGGPADQVDVYFQDQSAKVIDHTRTRLTVEMPWGVTGSGAVVARINNQQTNARTWQADVVDLVVQNLVVKTPGPLRTYQAIAFQATLINQGTRSIDSFPIRWTITRATSQRPWDTSQARYPLEDIPDDTSGIIEDEIYFHGPLTAQQTSTDPTSTWTKELLEPGIYRVSITIDPDNVLQDQRPTNNRFMREFVVEAPPPPPPQFHDSPSAFSRTSGRAGESVILKGSNFNQGTPRVLFGGTAAVIVGTPTATEITVRVPSMAAGGVRITVETSAGRATSTDTFTVLSSSYYSYGQAIGGNLL